MRSPFRSSGGAPRPFALASTTVALVVASATIAAPVQARPFRVDEIPNGSAKKCLNCHTDDSGKFFTDFGSDARTTLTGAGPVSDQHVSWQGLFARDSDYDTFTNGIELGDPTGAWSVGQPDPPGLTYNPGDPDSHPPGVCGNGVLEPDEECEGDEMAATDCAEITDAFYGSGPLTCADGCKFDRSACPGYAPDAGPPSGDSAASDGGCSVARAAGRCWGLVAIAVSLLAAARRRRRAIRRAR